MNYDELDPGIRRVVALLRSYGFETTDSGDGVSKPDCGVVDSNGVIENADFPHVYMVCDVDKMIDEAKRLYRILCDLGLDFTPDYDQRKHIEASYSPADGMAFLNLVGVNDKMLQDTQDLRRWTGST